MDVSKKKMVLRDLWSVQDQWVGFASLPFFPLLFSLWLKQRSAKQNTEQISQSTESFHPTQKSKCKWVCFPVVSCNGPHGYSLCSQFVSKPSYVTVTRKQVPKSTDVLIIAKGNVWVLNPGDCWLSFWMWNARGFIMLVYCFIKMVLYNLSRMCFYLSGLTILSSNTDDERSTEIRNKYI